MQTENRADNANPHLKDEYIDLSNNLMHWNTLRFAALTIFIAVTGGIMNVLYIGT